MTTQYHFQDKIKADTDKRNFPSWVYQLDWPAKPESHSWTMPKVAPQPLTPITRDQYVLATLTTHEPLHSVWYSDWTLPDDLGRRWTVHTHIYHSKGIVAAHVYLGGQVYDSGKWPEGHERIGSYVFRFFRLGCTHQWKNVVARMCYRENVCQLCGLVEVIDSSG